MQRQDGQPAEQRDGCTARGPGWHSRRGRVHYVPKKYFGRRLAASCGSWTGPAAYSKGTTGARSPGAREQGCGWRA